MDQPLFSDLQLPHAPWVGEAHDSERLEPPNLPIPCPSPIS